MDFEFDKEVKSIGIYLIGGINDFYMNLNVFFEIKYFTTSKFEIQSKSMTKVYAIIKEFETIFHKNKIEYPISKGLFTRTLVRVVFSLILAYLILFEFVLYFPDLLNDNSYLWTLTPLLFVVFIPDWIHKLYPPIEMEGVNSQAEQRKRMIRVLSGILISLVASLLFKYGLGL